MSRRDWLVAGSLIVVIGACAVQTVRDGRPPRCRSQLRLIGLALLNYHSAYGSFPPAYVAEADGRAMHSWRVLLLPMLDEGPLYREYRFDEPWDGPNNHRLAERMPEIFRCPDDERLGSDGVLTTYCAVSQAGAAFEGSRSVRLDEFRDGPSNTILVVESPGPPVHWMQPADISPQELQRFLATKKGIMPHEGGIHVALADGRAAFLPQDVPAKTLRALCTIAGGEAVQGF